MFKKKKQNILNGINFINKSRGMSLVEFIISITLLSLLFTIYAGFVEVASRFTNKQVTNLDQSNGLLIDHHYMSLTLDKYINFLSQPGITSNDIDIIKNKTFSGLPVGCSRSPNIEWNIPVSTKPIAGIDWKPSNAGYVICLKSTSINESSLEDLISKSQGNMLNAQTGLYFLLALPDEVSFNALPMRKLFCRPHPFC
ncbi:prepilin-type N-terminal cleavage/methylation domain-containing protein [Prochlorococcus sp. MIT 0801]|uniref:prepilin-type N-terminal cleavage/methylation domain-containing protein n=1 Tax=Prochlorococcus sp. MIT 0801 TaxID=1501269 RepID=UPI0004F745A3|nr:prepilin-type N-terminal cleavage/methylation domain-containing protein [Prochlorococcus sp. MIT 0801]AIQ97332.1 hypothetical protein EW15_1240 [Prochlorococcus sp. MIT 0801]